MQASGIGPETVLEIRHGWPLETRPTRHIFHEPLVSPLSKHLTAAAYPQVDGTIPGASWAVAASALGGGSDMVRNRR